MNRKHQVKCVVVFVFCCCVTAHVQKKYFKAWRLGAAMDKKEPSETDPIVPKNGHDDREVRYVSFDKEWY